MNTNDKQRFQNALALLDEIEGHQFDAKKLKVWWLLLEKYEIESVEDGVRAHLSDTKEGRYKAKPSTIMGRIEQLRGDLGEKASLAWAQVIHELSATGPYRAPNIDDKQALAVIDRLGGWQSLCSKTYDELKWLEKEFNDTYNVYENVDIDRLPSSMPLKNTLIKHKTMSDDDIQSAKNAIETIKGRLH